MAYDPDEPRDEAGRWTDGVTSSDAPAGAKLKMIDRMRQEELGFAPYRSQHTDTIEKDQQTRDTTEYKQYIGAVEDMANKLHVDVVDKADTWGGYVDSETKVPVQEVSNIIHVSGNRDRVELMAAVIGKIAPEIQDSVLLAHYDMKGAGTEVEIETGSFAKGKQAIEYRHQHGIENFSLDTKTGKITILDPDNTNHDNISGFIDTLKSKKLYETGTYTPAEVRFVGQGDYEQIIREQGAKVKSQTGFDANAFISEQRKKYAEAVIAEAQKPT